VEKEYQTKHPEIIRFTYIEFSEENVHLNLMEIRKMEKKFKRLNNI